MKYLNLILLLFTAQAIADKCEPEVIGQELWYNPTGISIDTTPLEQYNGGQNCGGESFIIQEPPRGGYADQDYDDFSYIVPELTQGVLNTSVSIDFKSLFDGLQMGSKVTVFEFDVKDINKTFLNLRVRLKKRPLINSSSFKWKVHVLWYDKKNNANGNQIQDTNDYFWISDDEVDSGWLELLINNYGYQTTVQAVSHLQDVNGALVELDQSFDPDNPDPTKLRQVINYASPFSQMNGLTPEQQRIGIIDSTTSIPEGSGMATIRY